MRPEAYVEINNFYTATVYEKGAEVIRMLHLLTGPEAYRKALDLYFERHDGQACTIEDWLKVFEDSTGRDLSQFALWYSQAGTPRVTVSEAWENGEYALTLRQEIRPTPGQETKSPLVIPCAYGFLGKDGAEIGEAGVLLLDQAEQTFRFPLPERPVASLFRGFSAPVIVEREMSAETRAFLMRHDSDPFNRQEAARDYGISLARAMIDGADMDPAWIDAKRALALDEALDPAFRALALGLPGQDALAAEIAASGGVVDPDAIYAAIKRMKTALAEALAPDLPKIREAMKITTAWSPDADQAGRRSLANAALSLLTITDGGAAAEAAFKGADNMTDSLAALSALVHNDAEGAEEALQTFHSRWKDDGIVIDKWYMVQATSPAPDVLEKISAIANSSSFNWRQPNKFRALIGAFAAANPVRFHDASGAGYRFLADWLIRLDDSNPQTAARVAGAFETWARFDENRQKLIRAELSRIAGREGLSKDMGEMVGRMLG